MKKILTLICALFTTYVYSQGNLQFSAVKYIKLESVYNFDTLITIPIGKVWKIESAAASFTGTYYPRINLDNATIAYGLGIATPFPIWLSNGTYTFSLIGGGSPGNGFISAIEYNIVP